MALSPIVWLAVGLTLFAAEVLVPGFVVFWFGVGGVLTALLVYLRLLASAEAQWLFFFVSSFAFLGLWFGYLKKRFSKGDEGDFRDPTLVNLRGRCTRRIAPSAPGEVELFDSFHGIRKWQAESGEVIDEGDEVSVQDARGIKLIVKKHR